MCFGIVAPASPSALPERKIDVNVNAAYENIISRRTIRKFKADPVPRELVDQVIEAGLWAPSGMGSQSPIVVAVTDEETHQRLAKANRDAVGFPGDSDPFYGAPVILIVLASREVPTHVYDGSCALENMQLAAHALGLGSVWVHRAQQVFDLPEWREWLEGLGIEGDFEGVGHCCIGYADQAGNAAERKPGRVFWA